MYEVKAYHCSYCKGFKLRKAATLKHEEKCFYNPATRSCATCLFYDRKEITNEVFATKLVCYHGMEFYQEGKLKLNTNCSLWVERPLDEEERITELLDRGFTP